VDEPTSGLDSQSAWSICAFLRKLADSGQAVLCTIHQPSAILFEQFDRLLFLRKGGQTVYFGDIGKDSRTLLNYFVEKGARVCDDRENPAEYMLEVVGQPDIDWHEIWKASSQNQEVYAEIERIHSEKSQLKSPEVDASTHAEFAAPFSLQLREVGTRVFKQFWLVIVTPNGV
jgi:ATP-binding cassette, subfamily G (WHITE), member 2, PDR